MGGGVDSIGGIPTFTKTMILIITFHGSFFFGFGTQKTCTKKTSNTWVILCDGAEIAAENSRALKQETSIWHRAIHGSAGIKGFIGKSNLIQCASTIFCWAGKRSSFLPQNFKPNTGFSSKRTLGNLVFTPRNNQVLPSNDSSAGSIRIPSCRIRTCLLAPD